MQPTCIRNVCRRCKLWPKVRKSVYTHQKASWNNCQIRTLWSIKLDRRAVCYCHMSVVQGFPFLNLQEMNTACASTWGKSWGKPWLDWYPFWAMTFEHCPIQAAVILKLCCGLWDSAKQLLFWAPLFSMAQSPNNRPLHPKSSMKRFQSRQMNLICLKCLFSVN